jgi:hypothetical protein
MKRPIFVIIIGILTVLTSCEIEDLSRDNENDGVKGNAELYISSDIDLPIDLYLQDSHVYTFYDNYETDPTRSCGFDPVYEHCYKFKNSPGSYHYTLKIDDAVLTSDYFYLHENSCSAIDLMQFKLSTAELYVSFPILYYTNLYIDNELVHTLEGYYTGYINPACGFDQQYQYVYKFTNEPGNYSYRLEYQDGTYLKSGTFYITEDECNAIDLYTEKKNYTGTKIVKANPAKNLNR